MLYFCLFQTYIFTDGDEEELQMKTRKNSYHASFHYV